MTLILSGTDGLSDVDGTAATPAIRGTDTNTGIFFPAADTIAFSEGGTEVARLDSSGNLLVGTTSASTPGTGFISVANTFGFKNRIINGGMVIDQRNAGASVSFAASNSGYTVDRMQLSNVTDGAWTAQRSTTTATGFTNSLLLTVTTADASLGATQFASVQQLIEGFNVADLGWGTANAQTVTLSFWVRCSLTGTFGGAFVNSAQNRSYPFTYTINSANTFEYKTVTVAGDTSGTWLTDNGIGIRVYFSLGTGSTLSGTAGAWSGSTFVSPTGAVSVVGTNGATFYITGVQLEKGSTATSFDYRPYGTELMLCQRYAQVIRSNASSTTGLANLACISSTRAYGEVLLAMQMRSAPTISFSAANTFSTRDDGGSGLTLTAIIASNTNIYSFDLDISVSSGLGAGNCTSTSMLAGTSGLITISAEL